MCVHVCQAWLLHDGVLACAGVQECTARQESDVRDGQHAEESLSWLAIDSGSYHLANGVLLQAGHVEAAGNGFEVVMTTPFEETDEVIVVTQVQTFNGETFVKTRQRPANGHRKGAFEVRLEPAEGGVPHGEETIGFVAVAASSGSIGIMSYEAARLTISRSQDSQDEGSFVFHRNFTDAPHVFGSIGTINNADPAMLLLDSTDGSQTAVRMQEDKCVDNEVTRQNTDAANLLVIGADGDHVLRGTPMPRPQVKCRQLDGTFRWMEYVEVGQYISWSAAEAMAARYAAASGSSLAIITSAEEQQCLVEVSTIVQEEYHETGIGWLGGTDAEFRPVLHDITSLRHGQGWVVDSGAFGDGWSGSDYRYDAQLDRYTTGGLSWFDCGSLGRILGPVGRGGYLTKTYTNLPAHETLRLELDFVRLDSWDGERASVYVDGIRKWTTTLNHNRGSQVCLGSTRDQSYGIMVELPHTASTVTINVTTTLNEAIDNEAFGISNIVIYTHSTSDTSWRWISSEATWDYEAWHQGVPSLVGTQNVLLGSQPSGDDEHYLTANWPTYEPGEWHDCRSEQEAEEPPVWPRCFYQFESNSRDVSSGQPTADCRCVSIPHTTMGLPQGAGQSFSVTAVFTMRSSSVSFTDWRSIFLVGEISGQFSPAAFILPAIQTADGPRHRLHIRTSTRLNPNAGCTTYGTISADNRTHLAVAVDGSDLRVYLNGNRTEGCTYSDTSEIFSYTAPLFIGGDPFYSGFDGQIALICLHTDAVTQATVDALRISELEAAAHGVSVGAEGSAVALIEEQTRARVLFDKKIPFRHDAVDRRLWRGVDTLSIPQANLHFPRDDLDASTFSVEFTLNIQQNSAQHWRNVMHLGDCKVWLTPNELKLEAAVSESDDPARWAIEGSSCRSHDLYLNEDILIMLVINGPTVQLYVNGDANEHGCTFTLRVGTTVDTTLGLFLGDSNQLVQISTNNQTITTEDATNWGPSTAAPNRFAIAGFYGEIYRLVLHDDALTYEHVQGLYEVNCGKHVEGFFVEYSEDLAIKKGGEYRPADTIKALSVESMWIYLAIALVVLGAIASIVAFYIGRSAEPIDVASQPFEKTDDPVEGEDFEAQENTALFVPSVGFDSPTNQASGGNGLAARPEQQTTFNPVPTPANNAVARAQTPPRRSAPTMSAVGNSSSTMSTVGPALAPNGSLQRKAALLMLPAGNSVPGLGAPLLSGQRQPAPAIGPGPGGAAPQRRVTSPARRAAPVLGQPQWAGAKSPPRTTSVPRMQVQGGATSGGLGARAASNPRMNPLQQGPGAARSFTGAAPVRGFGAGGARRRAPVLGMAPQMQHIDLEESTQKKRTTHV